MTGKSSGDLYGPQYYDVNFGVPYDRKHAKWLEGSRLIAEEITKKLAPSRVLDIGCGKGFLVECLWDAGVEARGFDVSDYAISQVRPDIRSYCWVGSVADPIPDRYDLITCIEVLEHCSEEEIVTAVGNMTKATNTVLFSSTPFDLEEPTHQTVRPILYWINHFKNHSFYPDFGFDASFIMPHGILFRRQGKSYPDEILSAFASLLTRKALFDQQDKRRRALDWKGEQFDEMIDAGSANVGPIQHGNEVRFNLVAQRDRLCRIDLFYGTYVRVNACHVQFRLLDTESGVELRRSSLSARVLPNNAWYPWRFIPVEGSRYKSFSVEVTSPAANSSNAITVYVDQNNRISYRAYSLQPSPEDGWFQEFATRIRLEEGRADAAARELESRSQLIDKLQLELRSKDKELEARSQLIGNLQFELGSKNHELEAALGILAAQENSAVGQLVRRFRNAKERALRPGTRRRAMYEAVLNRVRRRLSGHPALMNPPAEVQAQDSSPAVEALVHSYRPKVSVVSAVYNKEASLETFLEAFSRQNYRGPIEIVFVDDASSDSSADLIEDRIAALEKAPKKKRSGAPKFEMRLLRNSTNLGNCAARNKGLAAATGEIAIVIDADCIVNKDFVRAHVAAHSDPFFQVVLGPFNLESGDQPALDVVKAYEAQPNRVLAEMQLQDPENKTSFLNCITRNFSIKRERIEEPLFDEAFGYTPDPTSGFGWEDIEMGYRVYRRGLHIQFVPGAFSVHMSHPPAVPEKEKPLKSLRNFRRLHEKHPELAETAPRWSGETYGKIREWMKTHEIPDNDDVAVVNRLLQKSTPSAPAIQTRPKRLRVLTYRWHCGHQYELYKLPFDFTLASGLTGFTSNWDYDSRPLRPNARITPRASLDFRDFDLAILHFDEFSLAPDRSNGKLSPDWGDPFKFLMSEFAGPKVAICHGTPMFHGAYDLNADVSQGYSIIEEERARLVEFTKNSTVICNSNQAREEWGFYRSRTIWHGFDPVEYPPSVYQKQVITVAGNMLQRPHYRGYFLYRDVFNQLSCECDYLGDEMPNRVQAWPVDRMRYATPNDYAYAKFLNYVTFIRMYSIFFNPTLRSPMPRTRGEAMMCGLAIVSANNHDVNEFIRNGENGFYSNDPKELADMIERLARDPMFARKIGETGRRTAMDLFHVGRYHADWHAVIQDALGSGVVSAGRGIPSEKPADTRVPSVLYLSACSGSDNWCYRCDEIPEHLQIANLECHKLTSNDSAVLASLPDLLGKHNLVLFHRFPREGAATEIIRMIHDKDAIAVLDVEDGDLSTPPAELSQFDFFLCRSLDQQKRLHSLKLASFLLPSSYTQEQWNLSQIGYRRKHARREFIRLGFFASCAEAEEAFRSILKPISSILGRFPQARLFVIGSHEVEKRFKFMTPQWEFWPLPNWRKLPLLRAEVDVNLIPQASTGKYPFNAESEYIQSALLRIPSIVNASMNDSSLESGVNAYVASRMDEWESAMESLINSPESRKVVGERAFVDVQRRYSPSLRARQIKDAFDEMFRRRDGGASISR